jgi:hypothetical protein
MSILRSLILLLLLLKKTLAILREHGIVKSLLTTLVLIWLD